MKKRRKRADESNERERELINGRITSRTGGPERERELINILALPLRRPEGKKL
jgi:hypothetical protein